MITEFGRMIGEYYACIFQSARFAQSVPFAGSDKCSGVTHDSTRFSLHASYKSHYRSKDWSVYHDKGG